SRRAALVARLMSQTSCASSPEELQFDLRREESDVSIRCATTLLKTEEEPLLLSEFTVSALPEAAPMEASASHLEDLFDETERIIYAVSHDLKAPLVTIQGFGALLQEALARQDHALVQSAADKMLKGTDAISSMLDDLTVLSRVGRGAVDEWIDLNGVVDDIRASLSDRLTAQGAHIAIDAALPELYAKRQPLREMLYNLIENALDHGCGQPSAEIHIGYEEDVDHYALYVRDQGAGIPVAHQRRIFVLFRKLSKTAGGNGVGLAIAQKAARVLGGGLWLESTPGAGSTFWCSVPKRQGSWPDTDDLEPHRGESFWSPK
ncbi:MAG: ATP-binding protein, partial [Myxococcota bacterium]